MANTTIKISALPNIGNALAGNSLIPIVDNGNVKTTDKVTVASLGNIILSQAGGNFVNAQLATFSQTVVNAAQPNITSVGTLTSLTINDVANLHIPGGNNGYFLQTNGNGTLNWSAAPGNAGNGSPGGANTQVQFNDAGSFGGDAGFTYNKSTNTLNVENIAAGDSAGDTVNIIGNVNVTGNIALSVDLVSNGNITADYFIGNGSLLTGITTDIANYVAQPNQANITSLGNLQFLNIDGDTTSLGNISTSGNIIAGNINLSSNVSTGNVTVTNKITVGSNLTVNSSGTLRVVGTINTAGSPNINLGTLSNIHIGGGVNGYVLTTDGTGNLSWSSGGGGGNGTPGGSNTQIQYNSSGSFGGSAYFTFNDYTNTVQVGGNLIANSVQMGAGAYKWSTSFVYFATTNSSSPAQVLYSIPVTDASGVEFEIIATEPAGPSRQFCKINSMYYNGTVQFNEYASLFVNGGVGNFEVDYNAGNIIVQPSIELKVTPSSANPITYKMLITVFAP